MDDAITLDKTNDQAWNNRGAAKHRLGDPQGAINDLNKAIRLNPKNDTAWNNRGAVKNDLGDPQGAMDDYNQAIKLNSKNDMAWNNRGKAKHDLGDPQGAIDDYDEAIGLNPENNLALSNRGAARYALGDHQGAMDDYNRAIKLNPKNDAAWNNRGWAKYKLGKYEEAIKDYDEALRLNPDNKNIQNNQLAADIALKREKRAKNVIEKRDDIISALSSSIDEQKNRSKWLRRIQAGLLLILFAIIVLFFLLVFGFIECFGWSLCFSDHNIIQIFGGHSDTANPLRFFPVFSILGFIIMPIIWGLRITGQAIMQSSILEQDYFSRLHVMNSLDYYQSELGKDRNDLIIAYMESWMNDNTADRMERLYSKKTDAGKTPHEDVMKLCEQMIDKCMKKADNATKPGTK
ncbi:tetratricopeptide repeat protein [Alphaproteobacteria bacterium]|nr:tetratricopeptide repeat protein [Alphaproteobacteria bacterium]